ncbi:MAG: dUTP diphosphatase [Dehalococcoidia bacterium]
MEDIDLRVLKLHEGARLPVRATPGSSGLDICACLVEPLTLRRAPAMVPTGLAIEVPPRYDVQVRPRSGLSLKGIGVAFGTVDADYRGELRVTMWTFGDLDKYVLHDGDRIAQIVIARLAPVRVVEVDELSSTERGEGGHGSTGR